MNENQLREALNKIADIALQAAGTTRHDSGETGPQDAVPVCTPRLLPKRYLEQAARNAIEVNPMNAPMVGPLAALGAPFPIDPQRLTLLTSKYWGSRPRRLSVSFLERTPSDLRSRILSHLNAWNRTCSIEFVETSGTGMVRISRGPGGYWSYLGTDIMLIGDNRPTMNLQGFTTNTPEREFVRVVRHEAGHTLGFPHEHMRRELVVRIDSEKAYAYFWRTQGWDRQTVDQQVLTALDEGTIMGTPADQTSIMCYQLPGSITKDGRPIVGGTDINATDYAYAGRIYPKPVSEAAGTMAEEWDVEWEDEAA